LIKINLYGEQSSTIKREKYWENDDIFDSK